jgi:NADH-quinone oxidoreductase subunit H
MVEFFGETLFTYAVVPLFKIIAAIVVVLGIIAYTTLAERKILGFLQVRTGPNRVGPWGLFQPIADVAKLLGKEDVIPNRAVKWAYVLAPCLVVGPALIILSVIPFGPPSGDDPISSWFITDVNVGLLLVVAIASIGVYGLLLGGWASNNKFSMWGGLRAAAQMISHEVPQGFSLVVPLLMAGTLSLVASVEAQLPQGRWFIFGFFPFGLLAFFIYC